MQEGIVVEGFYVFQHKLVAPSRVTVWSDEVEATALDGGNGDLEVYLDNLNEEVKAQFAKLFEGLDDLRPLVERLLTNTQLSDATFETMRRRIEAARSDERRVGKEGVRTVRP